MRFVSTAAQSRELDRRVIEDLGLPGIALMELAARGVAGEIALRHADDARQGVVVVCGPGNNGGDGYAVARWLRGWRFPVRVVAVGEPRPGSDAATMAACARSAGVVVETWPHELGQPGLWVDALFGTGLCRPLTGDALEVLKAMVGAPVVAVDLPSGLDADTGRRWGPTPTAATTVTFGRTKLGSVIGDGPATCGRQVVVDLGLDAGTPPEGLAAAEIPDAADLTGLWPRRGPDDHKHRSGHLLVVAGSAPMAGAAVLTCRAALAAGVGLVTLVAPRGAWPRLATLPPEVMVWGSGEGDLTTTLPSVDRATAVVAGPGLAGGASLDPELARGLRRWWTESPLPVLFDADALPATAACTGRSRVLTPHSGEAARLLDIATADVVEDRLEAARQLSTRGVALVKGRPTVIAALGSRPSLNPTGGPVLATAGSGDVLAGVIGALLARGVPARDAARLGAFVHGASGDRLAARRSQGWTAMDVAMEVPEVLAALEFA